MDLWLASSIDTKPTGRYSTPCANAEANCIPVGPAPTIKTDSRDLSPGRRTTLRTAKRVPATNKKASAPYMTGTDLGTNAWKRKPNTISETLDRITPTIIARNACSLRYRITARYKPSFTNAATVKKTVAADAQNCFSPGNQERFSNRNANAAQIATESKMISVATEIIRFFGRERRKILLITLYLKIYSPWRLDLHSVHKPIKVKVHSSHVVRSGP